MKKLKKQNSGFTVLELLIATTIFSTILLLSTYGLINIGNTYYKGVITSRTQNDARNAMEAITQAIQYGGSAPPASDPASAPRNPSGILTVVDSATVQGVVCFGQTRIQYNKGEVLDGTEWALKIDRSNNCNIDNQGKEILGQGMQLANFSITEFNGYYTINMVVAHAETSMLDNGFCRGGSDSKYCATVNLETTVRNRVK